MQLNGRFGQWGGCFVPEILMPALEELECAFLEACRDPAFAAELNGLLSTYAGRPTPLTLCRNIGGGKVRLYLKREDLLHGGAHKTNQVLAQALLAKRMGKSRLIAETGAGQHGVATAMAGALLGLDTRIYMGAEDAERQKLNVFRMELMGAEVVPVETGGRTLKDAINEALRDWSESFAGTHYLLGTVAGPHPFPTIVREYQRVIGKEAREQILKAEGRLPDAVIACVGGGSNAMGIFADFLEDRAVRLIGVEAAGRGLDSPDNAATLLRGRPGILHGAETLVLADEDGQVRDTWSVSAGLDYPAVGPEHVYLKESGRAEYAGITDAQALEAFARLAREEGILCAFESAHALGHALGMAERATGETVLIVNLSGRGDKDVAQAQQLLAANASGQAQAQALLGTRLDGEPQAQVLPGAGAARPARQTHPEAFPGSLPGTRMSRYSRTFSELKARGEGALAGFVMLGDPDLETSALLLDALVDGGADMIEVGLPFSDPVADGPVIQAAAARALAAGARQDDCFALLAGFRGRHEDIPVGILTYANPVMARGREAFCRAAAQAGVDSVLVADVPALESEPFVAAARDFGLDPVLIAATNTPAATLERIAKLSSGYVYCLSRKGVTGVRSDLRLSHRQLLTDLREAGAAPTMLGFGIATGDHVRAALLEGADGAIVGSAIVQLVETWPEDPAGPVRELVASLKAATRDPVTAAALTAPASMEKS